MRVGTNGRAALLLSLPLPPLPGASTDSDGGDSRGAVFTIFLARDGSVRSYVKLSSNTSILVGQLNDVDRFGWAVELLTDLNLDGTIDLAVGAASEDRKGGRGAGSVRALGAASLRVGQR
jgi:hypothetical protein